MLTDMGLATKVLVPVVAPYRNATLPEPVLLLVTWAKPPTKSSEAAGDDTRPQRSHRDGALAVHIERGAAAAIAVGIDRSRVGHGERKARAGRSVALPGMSVAVEPAGSDRAVVSLPPAPSIWMLLICDVLNDWLVPLTSTMNCVGFVGEKKTLIESLPDRFPAR